MKLNIMVSLKSIMINHNELFLYAIKEGKECNDKNKKQEAINHYLPGNLAGSGQVQPSVA